MHNKKIIGFVGGTALSTEKKVGIIFVLYVLPEYWGEGVGKTLIRTIMDSLRELELEIVTLWVLRDNHLARRFYERLGWRTDGQTRIEEYGGTELEVVCYRISL